MDKTDGCVCVWAWNAESRRPFSTLRAAPRRGSLMKTGDGLCGCNHLACFRVLASKNWDLSLFYGLCVDMNNVCYFGIILIIPIFHMLFMNAVFSSSMLKLLFLFLFILGKIIRFSFLEFWFQGVDWSSKIFIWSGYLIFPRYVFLYMFYR